MTHLHGECRLAGPWRPAKQRDHSRPDFEPGQLAGPDGEERRRLAGQNVIAPAGEGVGCGDVAGGHCRSPSAL